MRVAFELNTFFFNFFDFVKKLILILMIDFDTNKKQDGKTNYLPVQNDAKDDWR